MPSTVDKISTTIGMGYRARQLADDQSEVDLRVYSYLGRHPQGVRSRGA